MHDVSEFPFNITDVARILNLRIRRKMSNSWYADCPFCGERKGKLNINTQKQVFRCNRCGASGGMLRLYGDLYNVTHKEAFDEICCALHLETTDQYEIRQKQKADPAAVENADLASLEVRNRTYSLLLSYLTLSEKHREDLKARGLTDEQIDTQRYRSVPVFGYKSLVKKLLAEGCVVKGVPGFYMDKDGEWTINLSAKKTGFLIPVCVHDNIQGFQIRLDRPKEGQKYIWLSSVNYSQGVSSGSPVHVIGDLDKKNIYITEGALKGTIAHYLSGETYVCLAGVNQYRNLEPLLSELKAYGIQKVCEAYDMDKKMQILCEKDYGEACNACNERDCMRTVCTDEHGKQSVCPRKVNKRSIIQNGCQRLYEMCERLGLPYRRMVWDLSPAGEWNGNIKGIDDYYYALQED